MGQIFEPFRVAECNKVSELDRVILNHNFALDKIGQTLLVQKYTTKIHNNARLLLTAIVSLGTFVISKS